MVTEIKKALKNPIQPKETHKESSDARKVILFVNYFTIAKKYFLNILRTIIKKIKTLIVFYLKYKLKKNNNT